MGDEPPDQSLLLASQTTQQYGSSISEANSGLPAVPPIPEQRRHRREALSLRVLFQASGREVASFTSDLSPGGLRITLHTPLRLGIPVSLHLSFGELCFLKLSGQVVHCQSLGHGRNAIAIKFSALRDWNQQILSSAIQELKVNDSTLSKSFVTVHVSKDHLALEAASISRAASESRANSPTSELDVHGSVRNQGYVDQSEKLVSGKARKFTPDPPWVAEMNRYLDPYRQAIWQSRLVRETSTGELSLEQVRGWSIQFYPFIEHFPQFMATYLAKAPDPPSRAFLIDNLRVEKRHADQWVDMAKGFGLPKSELLETPIIPEVEALTHWMWSITNRGSFVEAVSATNFAIEGVTQGIATRMVRGFTKYHGTEGVFLAKKAYYWMEAHGHYDDLHPYQALEIIKLHATSAELQYRVRHAAQRSFEYLFRALEACYWAYAPEPARS